MLIDATRSGARPGTLTCFDAIASPLPRPLFHNSTHEFGLAEAVELAGYAPLALGEAERALRTAETAGPGGLGGSHRAG